ncbi:hypothetical protein [Gordonia sp. CNJ-863]|uniref:hypothetical protein n=1 Tax=Gordonia sp. CNJ-863 TaxID=1904963 RepID=UPI001C9E43DD|nr:hypothetical protein [Gordonia sp. CNJ-863]
MAYDASLSELVWSGELPDSPIAAMNSDGSPTPRATPLSVLSAGTRLVPLRR